MKNFKFFMLAMLLSMAVSSCHTIAPNAGEEAVLVSKPYIGQGKVFQQPISTGRTFCRLTTKAYMYSLLPLKITESFDDIMTSDNNPVDVDCHIIFKPISGKTPQLHEEFGKNVYSNNIREQLRSLVRKKISNYKMFTLTTERQIVDSLQIVILNEMKDYVINQDIPITVDNVIIGKVIPPVEVLAQTIATAAQKQALRTYDAQTIAEVQRALSEKARATADNAYAKEMKMTVDQYLKSVELENQKSAIENKADVSFVYGIQATYVK